MKLKKELEDKINEIYKALTDMDVEISLPRISIRTDNVSIMGSAVPVPLMSVEAVWTMHIPEKYLELNN